MAWANSAVAGETSFQILSQDSSEMVLQLVVSDFTVKPSESGPRRLTVNAEGMSGWTSAPGYPRLPCHSVLLAIPPGASVDLQLVRVESSTRNLPMPVESAPEPISLSSPDRSPELPGLLAEPARVYPQRIAAAGAPMYFRDQRLLRLDFYPFQVDLASSELVFHRRIILRLLFTEVEPAQASQVVPLVASTDALLKQAIPNFAQGRQWRSYPSDLVIPESSLDTDSPVYRIEVDHDGMYRIGYQELTEAGMDVGNTNPLSLSVSSQGNLVSIDWLGDDDEFFESDEAFVFYGQEYRGTPFEEQYTDSNVYWLEISTQPGLRMDTVPGTPSGALGVRTYRAAVHVEKDAKFTHLHTIELGEVDIWYMQKTSGPATISFPLTLTAVASGLHTATIRLEQFSDCRYNGNPEFHQVALRLNGTLIVTQAWQSQGGTNNCSLHLLSGQIGQEDLIDGPGNTVTWIVSTTHPYGEWLNWWEVSYQRELDAIDDRLTFGLDPVGERVFSVTGFTTGTIGVWDISSPDSPTKILFPVISGEGPYEVSFQLERAAPGMAIAAALDSLEAPVKITKYTPPDLDPPGGADWVAITHHDFITEVRRLAAYRELQGLRAWVVDLSDVYNQYSDGIYQPAAIHDYLVHGLSWVSPAPSYVVLVGDGNWNYKSVPDCYVYCDPDPIYVPPYMGLVDPYQGQVPADNLFATLVYTDAIPDIALGRLPVRTVTETARLVDRIIQHEAQLIGPEEWQYQLTFLADEYDPSAGDFRAQSEAVVGQLPTYFDPNRIYHMQAPYTSSVATRDGIVQAFNQGSTLVNYRGHGGILVWGDDGFFSVGNLGLLTNTERSPVIFSFDCLDTYYAIPSLQSLSETMMRNTPAGSVAHWGSSGLGISSDHLILNRALFAAVFDNGLGRTGDAILAAKLTFAGAGWQMHNLHTFTLLGDPAMPLVASDLRVEKSAVGDDFRHTGNSLSYVIRLSNQGLLWSTGTVITDLIPVELIDPRIQWKGLAMTRTAGVSYTWMVTPVLPHRYGIITVSGRIDPSLAATTPFTLANTATATSAAIDWDVTNNSATARVAIIPGVDVYLPFLVSGH